MLPDLESYLTRSGWTLEEPVGQYEVLRARRPGYPRPLLIHDRTTGGCGYSIDERDMKVYAGWKKNRRMKRAADSIGQLPQEVRSFFSMEPLMENVAESEWWKLAFNGAYANWIIIGAMTGPGSESQQPCREWVERIVDDVKNELSPFYPIPVFMKGNLRKVWGRDLIQEFPEKLEAQG